MKPNIKCAHTEAVPLPKITPHPDNENKHNKKQIQALAKIIAKLGQRSPIVISNRSGKVVKGHGRLEAIQMLGWDTAAVDFQDYSSELEELNDRVADNEIARYAEFQVDRFEVNLKALDVDIKTLDLEEFGLLDLDYKDQEDDPKEDEIPTPPDPVTRPGDVYELGNHRLICGDSTDASVVAMLMDGDAADLVFTDPPYNVDYQGSDGQKIKNDKMDYESFREFCLRFTQQLFDFSKPGAPFYMWHADTEGHHFREAVIKTGFHLASTLIWNKNALIMGRSDYHWKHEPCLYGWKPGAKHKWYSDRKQTTVFDHQKGSGADNKMHPTCKPVSLCEYFIGNSSAKDDLILDLFGGSGSTMITAEKLGRRANLMELDEHFCDIIVQRWVNYTEIEDIKRNGEKMTWKVRGADADIAVR